MSSVWELLSPVPFECFSEPVQYDCESVNQEFIFVPYKWTNSDYNENVEGIYKYNANNDDWMEWIKYPQTNDFVTSVHTSAINKKTNTLYIYNAQKHLITMDLIKESVDIQKAPIEVSNYAKSIVIHDKLHIIGGNNNCTHFVIDPDTKNNHEIIYNFQQHHGDRLYGHCIIHLKSQQCLLLIGGEGKPKTSDNIYRYSLSGTIANNYKNVKWELLNIKLPESLSQFGYIVTNDDKYVIIFGGINKTGCSKTIYTLDTMEMKWIKNNIQCPGNDRFHAFITGNIYSSKLLVNGFIKKLTYLPIDVINIIVKYHLSEYVHLLEHYKSGNHWRIGLMDLFQNTFDHKGFSNQKNIKYSAI